MKNHVVSLKAGRLSTGGAEAIEAIFRERIPEWMDTTAGPHHVVFWAHGGLVPEKNAVKAAMKQLPLWVGNGVYPLFFVWHTGALETILDILRSRVSARGLFGWLADIADRVIESAARPGGVRVWGQIKRNAALCLAPGGGGSKVAEETAALVKERPELHIHAAGHSAGSIFHTHFVQALFTAGVERVETLQFLAPAVDVPTFKSGLLPLIGDSIRRFVVYTMKRQFERNDKAGPYRKSLLYLIHRAFEEPPKAPLLGLEEHIRADRELTRLFSSAGAAELVLTPTDPDEIPPPSKPSSAVRHTGFDNDPDTMESVVRIVTGRDDLDADYDTRDLAKGRKRALCIGIDSYQAPFSLSGCVADAEAWGKTLKDLGYEVRYLLDGRATRAAILSGIKELLQTSRRGDEVVLQYAGHGTTVADQNGDEGDGTDEALCPVDGGHPILDDELRALLDARRPGVLVTSFMDCCHSGTITRMGPNGNLKARFMPGIGSGEAPSGPRGQGVRGAHEALFSACRPEEVAYESDGHGDFTRRALPLVAECAGRVTNVEFATRITAAFGKNARQHPQLDCPVGIARQRFLSGVKRD